MVTMVKRLAVLFSVAAVLTAPARGAAASDDGGPVVNAILFFSPTCGHCEYVINDVLPPLFADHGGPWEVFHDETLAEVSFYLLANGTLEFLLVDVTVAAGGDLFREATERYGLESNGVPRLIIDDEVYIGSADIPASLPGVVADGLSAGGLGWPDLDGLPAALSAVGDVAVVATTTSTTTSTTEAPSTTADATATSAATTSSTIAPADETTPTSVAGVIPVDDPDSIGERFSRDPVGNGFAVVVLVGMVGSLAGVALYIRRPVRHRLGIMVPLVAALGMAVAAYLTYIESTGSDAVCGPVGDCNAVQQSPYAELFGVIPIGLLGLVGYGLALAAWMAARREGAPSADWARVGLGAGTVAGVGFSIYLTFLEPFVIGATCAWCLTSAVLITVLMWMTVGPGLEAWRRRRKEPVSRSP